MTIEGLHPDAARNFNEKAEALLTLIKGITKTEVPSFEPDRFVARTIVVPETAAGPRQVVLSDGTGSETGRFFVHAGQRYGLLEQDHRAFLAIVSGMQRTNALTDRVSWRLLSDVLFEWVEERYTKRSTAQMSEFVLPRLSAEIARWDVWIPIAGLYIQSEFSLGRVTFRTLTGPLFDAWEAQATALNAEAGRERFHDERRRLQGLAAATITVEAERYRAEEIADAATTDAVALLRFFSSANHHPDAVSYTLPVGREHRERYERFLLQDTRLVQMNSGFQRTGHADWVIDDEALAMFREGGLGLLNELLLATRRSRYQDRLFDALLLYSRNCLAKDVADKLVYLLVPLESMLLKNTNEPITQNIAERIAFLVGKDRDDRLRIADVVMKTYGLRSAFLHHGVSVEDLETLRQFMDIAWRTMHGLLINMHRFETVDGLLASIERAKFS